jgi:succinoglycan biosynthesis transport protein ExoP
MRSIKLAIDRAGITKTNKVIGFTSSLPREGKSTTAASLALCIGQSGASVILLDCDLRNPTLTRSLTPDAKAGLFEVLSGQLPLEDAIWTDQNHLTAFLPAIVKPQFVNTAEILASRSVSAFFDKLRANYDYVLVDLPPLGPVVDTHATTHLIDSYIFVIQWGCTKIDVVEHALSRAPGVYENSLGALLNSVDMCRINAYDRKSASYYKNNLYHQYGRTD